MSSKIPDTTEWLLSSTYPTASVVHYILALPGSTLRVHFDHITESLTELWLCSHPIHWRGYLHSKTQWVSLQHSLDAILFIGCLQDIRPPTSGSFVHLRQDWFDNFFDLQKNKLIINITYFRTHALDPRLASFDDNKNGKDPGKHIAELDLLQKYVPNSLKFYFKLKYG